jgi:uncharacterized YccA/Bax inhibitor family protein
MANPTLNEQRFQQAFQELETSYQQPPFEGTRPRRMDLDGVITKTGLLLLTLVATAWVGWQTVDVPRSGSIEIPGWTFVAVIAALGMALWTAFNPRVARFTALGYAALEGLVVGVFSHAYEIEFDGIVLQAVGCTIGVFALMLGLYRSGTLRATPAFRKGVIAATGAIMLVYIFDLVLRLFGADVPFIHDAGPVGILISVAIVAVAAMNLILDFDFIENATRRGAPAYMEWYAAFGLLVTLVWLYLELLRLISKLRR